MVDFPPKFEAGSPYHMKVGEIDSAVRFSYVIIDKAKESINLIEKGKWDSAEKDILGILRALNRNNLNFQHMRQMIYGRKLENKLTDELKRLSRDSTYLIGRYKQIKKSKWAFGDINFKKSVELLLKDIIKQEYLLKKVFKSLKGQIQRSQGIFFAGINAGASSTRCVICDANGNKLGEGKSGPAILGATGFYKSIENILLSFRRAAENAKLNPKEIFVQRIAIGIWIELKENHLRYAQIFSKYIKQFSPNIKDVIMLPDTLVAWFAGLGGNLGILVLGGTGTYVYGYHNGRESDHNPYYGKIGPRNMVVLGGRHISFHAAKLLSKLIRSKNKSIMVQLVEDAFRNKKIFPAYKNLIRALKDLMKYYPAVRDYGKLKYSETAMLAPYVLKSAKMGDQVALKLIQEATRNQCFLISQVANDIGLHNKSFKVTYQGNFITRQIVLRHIKKELPAFEPKAQIIKPVIGDEMEALLKIARENVHFY